MGIEPKKGMQGVLRGWYEHGVVDEGFFRLFFFHNKSIPLCIRIEV